MYFDGQLDEFIAEQEIRVSDCEVELAACTDPAERIMLKNKLDAAKSGLSAYLLEKEQMGIGRVTFSRA
jgi:hypothetical protein